MFDQQAETYDQQWAKLAPFRDGIHLLMASIFTRLPKNARMLCVGAGTGADGNYAAYSPDLPGCVATGKTRDQVARNMHEAIEMYVRGLLEDRLPVPQSRSFAEYIAIPA